MEFVDGAVLKDMLSLFVWSADEAAFRMISRFDFGLELSLIGLAKAKYIALKLRLNPPTLRALAPRATCHYL
jgi:hypothetical protein